MNSAEQQLREQLAAAERSNSDIRSPLAPFLAMAKACEHFHDRETIAAASVAGNQIVYLDARDFRALAKAVSS